MNSVPKMKAVTKGISYHFDMMGPIEEHEDYIELLDALRDATENDNVNIHINTVGGDLAIVAQILHGMEMCQGTVTTHAEGQVFSGGSLVFFKGDELMVGPYAEFLAHGPHGGMGGKLVDIADNSKHNKLYVTKLYEDVYSDFYSKKEITSILRGKEVYETSEQVVARLEKAQAKMIAEENLG